MADDIVEIIESLDFDKFYDSKKQNTYVKIEGDGKNAGYFHPLKEKETNAFIQSKHYENYGKLLSDYKLKQVNQFIEFDAIKNDETDTARIRVHKENDTIHVDIGSSRFVVITDQKVRIKKSTEIPFIYRNGIDVEMEPDLSNGDLDLLRKYMIVDDGQFILIVVFILNCFFTDTHYLMLLLLGESGSGKSFVQKVIKTIVDPDPVMLRNQINNVEDLVLSARNCHLIDLNNVTSLSGSIQDTLCTILTGGCASTRAKFTNTQESVIHTHNPVIANGIGNIVSREDLYERTLIIVLKKIEGSNNPTICEDQLWADFLSDYPVIMGGLFNALSNILFEFKTFEPPPNLKRMANFHVLGLVTEKVLEWKKGSFEKAYFRNIKMAHDDVLIDSNVAQALIKWKERKNQERDQELSGTYDKIKSMLNKYADLGKITPRALSAELDRLSGALLNVHKIKIEKLTRSNMGSRIKITCD